MGTGKVTSQVWMFSCAPFLGLAWILFVPSVARACTCELPLVGQAEKQAVKKARRESQAIFVGKVLEVVEPPNEFHVSIRFEIERVWKGPEYSELEIFTGKGGGDCGYKFAVGETYLVYAFGPNELRLGTNICQRTKTVAAARVDLRYLGKPRFVTRAKFHQPPSTTRQLTETSSAARPSSV
jgi:hypothetical protein